MTDTILVVDDTPSKRYVLASWLRRGGYTVIEAATGAQALQLFSKGGIDLVVLDVRLPDVSGFEVCEQIKNDPVYGTTPVIHVSAAAIHAVDRTHGLVRGADAYLVEPIDPDEMLATVASILRYYQARLQAERLAARLANLVRASAAMGSATTHRHLLEIAASGGARIFGSPILLITNDADGARITATCAGPDEPVVVRPSMVELGAELLGVHIREEPAELWPQIGFPADGTVRVLTVRSRPDRPAIYAVVPSAVIAEGAPVLTLFGQAVMAATDALRLFVEEHNLALTLQRSLLPGRVPTMLGFDIAVRYVPAIEHAEVSGDFYEVLDFTDQVFIAVGDVGGHSLHAATVMAELRHATRAYLAEGHGPGAILDRLNRLMTTFIPGEIATLCLLSVESATGRVRLANAGHPPPALCSPVGVRVIEDHGPLLGIDVRPAAETQFDLAEGETLVVYTDGLIERRVERLDDSVARLTAAAATVEPDLEQFASRLLEEVGPREPSDDIALVAIRRRPAKSPHSRMLS
jgi:CheY-like chemotaxis protein